VTRSQRWAALVLSRYRDRTKDRETVVHPKGDRPTPELLAIRKAALGDWQFLAADSTGQRNRLAEHFSGRFKTESLAWSFVQLSRNCVEPGL
jgi:hypothetical protein